MLNNLFTSDSLIVLAIVMLLFGPKNLPKLSKSLGTSIRELKKGLHGLGDDENEETPAPTATVAAPSPQSDESQADRLNNAPRS